MWWKIILFSALGLMYYGYVRSNTDRAMHSVEHWKASYLQVMEEAANGNVPAAPAQLTAY